MSIASSEETRQSIFDNKPTASPISSPIHPDFLFEIQSSWDIPATDPAVSLSMDTLYRVHDVEKLGMAHFSQVDASIAALVLTPNF